MMKYLWLLFILTVAALTLQIKLADVPENPFADGELACLPIPPQYPRPEPPLLPAPALEHIPPPVTPPRVEATSIEIFNTSTNTGLMVETRQADNLDWGLPRSLPLDSPIDLAYAVEPRLVEPVPVNVPEPEPVSPPNVLSLLTDRSGAWHPALEKWSTETQLMAWIRTATAPLPEESMTLSHTGVVRTMKLYPVPEQESVETASLEPKELISAPQAFTPNLYLPDGALDEEGAKLTLIRPALKVYELPDENSAAAAVDLKAGDQVRPLTRLRNAMGYDWIKFESDGKSWWAQAEFFIRVDPRNRREYPQGNLAVGKERVDKDSALPVDYHPNDLVEIAGKWTFGAKNVQLRKGAAEAFERMAEAAEKDGHDIRIFSGFRDFDYQKRLYLKAVSDNGPKQDGTAAPGYSEHQLGTTADISSENRRTILNGKFGETPEGRWLHENSERFGFRKSYTSENTDEVGYKPEPWHFRYVGVSGMEQSADVAGR